MTGGHDEDRRSVDYRPLALKANIVGDNSSRCFFQKESETAERRVGERMHDRLLRKRQANTEKNEKNTCTEAHNTHKIPGMTEYTEHEIR